MEVAFKITKEVAFKIEKSNHVCKHILHTKLKNTTTITSTFNF